MDALHMLVDEALDKPPPLPHFPRYVGIISNPPCHIPMQSFDVWRTSGSDTSFQVVKICDGPILNHDRRSKFRKGGPFIDNLPLHVKDWFVNFGTYIHCSYDHDGDCETDPDEVEDDEEKEDKTVMYSPRHKIVPVGQAQSPRWHHLPEDVKPDIKTEPAEDPLQEYIEPPSPEHSVKKEPKNEEDGE